MSSRLLEAGSAETGAYCDESSDVVGSLAIYKAPPEGEVCPSSVPPCACTIALEVASPRPVPVDFVEKNGSKSLSSSPSGRPGPVSATASWTKPSLDADRDANPPAAARSPRGIFHQVRDHLPEFLVCCRQ